MTNIDLRKLALRLKVLEMLRIYARRREMMEPAARWQRNICPN
ncbi:MAG TPA: hypothetical protein QGF95_11370 [Candidatus Latescibacteria bacterium]|nr:hypothetical protein [Candidatus Latescibacterota bacterium]HJP31142.1 hypothetical protein [Candidatus Latescibacterota bacterium]